VGRGRRGGRGSLRVWCGCWEEEICAPRLRAHRDLDILQTHCNTLQRNCNTLNTLQHTATHDTTGKRTGAHYTAQHCLQYARRGFVLIGPLAYCKQTATHYEHAAHSATHCNTRQYAAKHCNALRRTALQSACFRMRTEASCSSGF